STGQPKGVTITHVGLANYLQWAATRYDGRGGAPVHSTVAFDLTVTSIFVPLVSGGVVEMLADDGGVAQLPECVGHRGEFGGLKMAAAQVEILDASLRPEELCRCARTIVVGGEALMWANIASWRARAPTTSIINEYGPTETVVGCCVYEVRGEEPREVTG